MLSSIPIADEMSVEEKYGKGIDVRRDSVLKLPFSFEVSQALDSYPLVITILQTLQAADLSYLTSSTIDNCSISKALDSEPDSGSISKVVFKVSQQIGAGLSTISTSYFFVKVQKRLADKDQRLAIIYKIKNDYYGIAYLAEGINYKDIALDSNERMPSFGTKEMIIDYMSIEGDLQIQGSDDMEIDSLLENFSMKPPITSDIFEAKLYETDSMNINDLVPPSTIEDPVSFLEFRYYNTLYSLNTPLSYIPKTAMARFRNLCSNNDRKISDLLAGLCLSVNQMDTRHHGKHGVLQLISSEDVGTSLQLSKLEIQNQQEFISRHQKIFQDISKMDNSSSNHPIARDSSGKIAQESNEKKFQRIVLELKMREAQLQTILLFELLHSWHIDESNFLESNSKKLEKEEKKRAKDSNIPLVRKKKSKATRKIVPTFLGMGVDVNEEKNTTIPITSIDQLAAYKNLNAIVDRMGLWDMLLGSSVKKNNENSIGFIAYVLVPYYNKKLPSIVKYVVDRVKDSNLKMKVNKAERKLTSRRDSPELPSNISSETTHTVTEQQKKKSSKYKKVVLTRKVPKLEKSLTSGLEDEYDLKPALSLKRSSSNLSYKNLKKRLVDLNDSTGEKNSSNAKASRSNSLSEKLSQQNQSSIFGNAKKTRLKSTVPQRHHSSTQVLATPMKNKSALIIPPMVAYTNLNSNGSIINSHSQVEATPNNAIRVIDMLNVIHTPEDHFVNPKRHAFTSPKSLSVSDKLMSASLAVDKGSHITSSPVKSPGAQSREPITPAPIQIESTPLASVRSINIINSTNSSKTRKRSKPGEPVSVMESPFYRARWNGSPTQSERTYLVEKVISDDELPSEQVLTFSEPSSKIFTEQSDNESDKFVSPKITTTSKKRLM